MDHSIFAAFGQAAAISCHFSASLAGCVKRPISALSCVLRRCGVLIVRLATQDLLALTLGFLLCRPISFEVRSSISPFKKGEIEDL